MSRIDFEITPDDIVRGKTSVQGLDPVSLALTRKYGVRMVAPLIAGGKIAKQFVNTACSRCGGYHSSLPEDGGGITVELSDVVLQFILDWHRGRRVDPGVYLGKKMGHEEAHAEMYDRVVGDTIPENTMAALPAAGPSIMDVLKRNFVDSGWGVIGETGALVAKTTAIAALNASKDENLQNLAKFAQTPFGGAFFEFGLGIAMEMAPGKFGGHPNVLKIARQLQMSSSLFIQRNVVHSVAAPLMEMTKSVALAISQQNFFPDAPKAELEAGEEEAPKEE